MLQNPIARVFGSQVSGIIVISVEDMPERDELSMTVGSITIVIWSMRCIAPDSVTALFISVQSIDKPDYKLHAFNHMLALPAQLRNRVCRSLREKKRSRTGIVGRLETHSDSEKNTNHKRRQDAAALCLSFRQTRTLPWLWPVKHEPEQL